MVERLLFVQLIEFNIGMLW